jgi:uridine kinase
VASTVRDAVLAAIAGRVPGGDRVRVAVDGPSGAGKTVFADELAAVLRRSGRPVLRASVDDFHRPRAERHRRGHRSPTGYWLDAYDYPRLIAELLEPFRAGRAVRPAVHDVRTDAHLDEPAVAVPAAAVLVLDGVFLHRDELARCWTQSVYLQVDTATCLRRMAVRDGAPADPADPYNRRYAGAWELYTAACAPVGRAGLVVDNTDLAAPRVITAAG